MSDADLGLLGLPEWRIVHASADGDSRPIARSAGGRINFWPDSNFGMSDGTSGVSGQWRTHGDRLHLTRLISGAIGYRGEDPDRIMLIHALGEMQRDENSIVDVNLTDGRLTIEGVGFSIQCER